MQEIEHEIQVKRLKQKMIFDEEEHMERMKLLKLQQDFVRRLHEKIEPAACESNRTNYSLYEMYTQMK